MQPQNPSSQPNIMQSLTSFYKVLRGNTGFGTPTKFDGAGNGTEFNVDNMAGQLVRIGSNVNPDTLPNFWAGTNAATTVTHNLNRLPIGWIVMRKSGACDIYQPLTAPNTTKTIILYTTDDTQDVLVFVF